MILLVFGWMLIASAFILIGWFNEGYKHRFPVTVYNAALMMSVGMDLHALGFMLQLGSRINQILFHGMSFDTDDVVYWVGVGSILIGKTMFVWVSAMGNGKRYSKKIMVSYWALIAAWAGFCYYWFLG